MRSLGVPAWSVAAAAMGTWLLAGCTHRPEVATVPAAIPAAPTVAPHVATGTYDLATTLARTPPGSPTRPSGRGRPTRTAPEAAASLQLAYQALAAPDPTASSRTQLAAVLNLPGYTRAPRGRPGQAVAWWPLPGDSVVVHFQPPQQQGGTIELRGMLRGDTLAGDIWYTSLQLGNVFQMGTFTAVKRRK